MHWTGHCVNTCFIPLCFQREGPTRVPSAASSTVTGAASSSTSRCTPARRRVPCASRPSAWSTTCAGTWSTCTAWRRRMWTKSPRGRRRRPSGERGLVRGIGCCRCAADVATLDVPWKSLWLGGKGPHGDTLPWRWNVSWGMLSVILLNQLLWMRCGCVL